MVLRTILAALVGAVALAGPAAGSARKPSITLVASDPVTVAGAHFRPHGGVRVTIYALRTVTRATTASRSGTFRLTFAGPLLGACSGTAYVQAVGAKGQVAALRIQRPSCMQR
jgi:hypothetical protein